MKTLLFFAATLFAVNVFAQNTVDTKVEILKTQVDAVSATYNYSADLVEETLKKRFEEAKLGSGDKSKGFRVYKGVVLNELTAEKVDIYTKVDGKKETSTVTIAISKGYNNFINSTTDEKTVQNLKVFLSNLNVDATKLKYTKEIEEQESIVKKSEKEVNSLESDGKGYKEDLEKLEKKIDQNKKDQEDARVNLEKQKVILQQLQEKLKEVK